MGRARLGWAGDRLAKSPRSIPERMNPIPSRYRVLIADDVPVVLQALRWVLNEVPELEIVGEASDGIQVVARARETSPHLVILDIQMPGLDGYAVTQQLKQMPAPPRIILLAGQSDETGPERARIAGCDAYVEKAEGWLVLIEQIRRVLPSIRRYT
jgi:DNA-binding NarL/FixJ family response regulator